jgi:hypothetical protein
MGTGFDRQNGAGSGGTHNAKEMAMLSKALILKY